jgi:hypothetical protein
MSEVRDKSSSQDYPRTSHQEALGGARNLGVRASVVNRTHRVVRERAKMLAARRSRIRSLWAPLTICSSLFVIICTAVWNVLDAYEGTPNGVPDASNQFLVLCLWFFPVSMALLALVLFRRARKREVAG